MNFSIHQASHIGNRKYNQDRVAYAYNNDALLLVLADGMGGHLHGEVAASIVMDTFVEAFSLLPEISEPMVFLSDTMLCAHQRIMSLPHHEEGQFPGTTCVAALVQGGRIYWGHAGDSRLYLLRKGQMVLRTLDHSIVQSWLDMGVIDEEEARNHPKRNQITNCLGGVENLFSMEAGASAELQRGDVVMMCSDGLFAPFLDKEVASMFQDTPVSSALDRLIAGALTRERGRSDNVTGIAMGWEFGEIVQCNGKTVSRIL
ncbi:MAG: protein phosphatase 2C domain-containing protein, partial [Gallionella sp.]|nr:protein phosphatase 2C domain-containing protein [Gallionella sp.]